MKLVCALVVAAHIAADDGVDNATITARIEPADVCALNVIRLPSLNARPLNADGSFEFIARYECMPAEQCTSSDGYVSRIIKERLKLIDAYNKSARPGG